jgi:hypothetical protein
MAFLDSDDWIEPHFTKILVHNMITYKAQISSCNSRSVSSEDEAYALCNEHISAPEVYNPLEYLNLVYTNNNVNVLICNKIYHKSLFDKVVFPVGELYEDVITNFLLCINSVRIVHTHTHLFNYFTSSTGITRSPLKEQDFQLINQWNRVLQLSKELSPELYNTIFARKITAYRALANKYMKYGTTDKKLAIKIKKLFLYELKKIIVCTKIPRSKKLHSIVAAFSIRLYYKFRHYGHG